MRAIILAAGLGTRLGDLTKDTPKCLVQLSGKSLLSYQVSMLHSAGIRDITIVIGKEGSCWTPDNISLIGELVDHVVVNESNSTTGNSYSLKLGLDSVEESDVLIIDGDLMFSFSLLKRIVDESREVILCKRSENKQETRKKVLVDPKGRVIKIGKDLEDVPFPYIVYGPIIKLDKQVFSVAKKILLQEKYRSGGLGYIVNDLAPVSELYTVVDDGWININTKEDIEEAKGLCHNL